MSIIITIALSALTQKLVKCNIGVCQGYNAHGAGQCHYSGEESRVYIVLAVTSKASSGNVQVLRDGTFTDVYAKCPDGKARAGHEIKMQTTIKTPSGRPLEG